MIKKNQLLLLLDGHRTGYSKYFEDPNESFGREDKIHIIVRKGLEQDGPSAYKIFDPFFWKTEDMEEVMVEVARGLSPFLRPCKSITIPNPP